MASIYDIAKIASGDPLGAATDAAKEADIIFNKYENLNKSIEEINNAIAKAKRKSRKNRLGSNILGTLVGATLGTLTGGFMNPGMTQRIVSGLVAGAGAGGVEKFRQDKLKATKELKELKEQYKNTSLGEDIDESIDIIEAEQDTGLQADILSNLLGEIFVPGKTTETFSQPDVSSKYIDMYPNTKPVKTLSRGLGREFSEEGKAFLQKLIPGTTKETFETESIILPLLARILGPAAFSQLQPKAVIDPLYQIQFKNPFRGG